MPRGRMLRSTIGVERPVVGRVPLTVPAVSLAAGAGMSRKPDPWSILPEPSASLFGLAPAMRALRIFVAEAVGNFSRSRAAAPAVVGEAKEVPETRLKEPFAPWQKLAKPLVVTLTLKRPSADGPRELKVAVWMPSNGR